MINGDLFPTPWSRDLAVPSMPNDWLEKHYQEKARRSVSRSRDALKVNPLLPVPMRIARKPYAFGPLETLNNAIKKGYVVRHVGTVAVPSMTRPDLPPQPGHEIVITEEDRQAILDEHEGK